MSCFLVGNEISKGNCVIFAKQFFYYKFNLSLTETYQKYIYVWIKKYIVATTPILIISLGQWHVFLLL